MAKVLLVVAQEGFQSREYADPKRVLENEGHTVFTASVAKGEATNTKGEKVKIDVAIADVHVGDYDAIFLIGGPGATQYLNTNETKNLMKNARDAHELLYGAICISPRILAKADVLRGRRVTGWDNDGKLEEALAEDGAIYVKEPVVVDGRVITADGPGSAEAFGHAIAHALKSEYA